MDKIAKGGLMKALKLVGGGLGVAGAGAGGGYLYGKRTGVQSGAEAMADELGKAFLTANAKENQQLRSAWEAKNKMENAQIANHFLRKGYQMGQANMSKAAGALDLDSIYDAAFNDELEKIAVSVPGLGLGKFTKRIAKAVAEKGGMKKILVNTAEAGKTKSVDALGSVADGTATFAKYLGKQWPTLAAGAGAGVAGGAIGGAMAKKSSDEMIEAAMLEELEKIGFSMSTLKSGGKAALKYLTGVGKDLKLLGRAATSKSPIYKGGFGSKGMGRRMNVAKKHLKNLKAPLAVAGGGVVGVGAGGYAAGRKKS